MQQHQLQARDLMDCGLEHFLLPVGLPEELSSELTGFAIGFKRAAIAFQLEQLLRGDLDLQPFPEVHRCGAVAPCCPMKICNKAIAHCA